MLSVIENDDGSEATGEGDGEKNKTIFAELVQYLDDKSLSLIIRDAKTTVGSQLKYYVIIILVAVNQELFLCIVNLLL